MNEPMYKVYIFCENCLTHKKIEIPKRKAYKLQP